MPRSPVRPRAAADDEKTDTPIGPREIVKGLDGMSRVAEKGNVFGLGHNAAAVISSAFFCREQKLDADTQKEILAYLDARLLKNPIYEAPRPKEAADPKLVEGLLEDLDAGIATLRGKGHNIIFAVTCLKALREVPEAATPERIAGLRKMVQSFGKTKGGGREGFRPACGPRRREEVHPLRVRGVPEGEGRRVRRARGDDRARPGRAAPHGAQGTGEEGRPGLLAVGPGGTRADKVKARRPRVKAPTPLAREYWAAQAKRRVGEIVSSHTVKYPYSFYALAKDVTDEDLKKRILAKVSRLTAIN